MKFVVEINARVAQDVEVKAASEDEAVRVAAEKVENGEVELDYDMKRTAYEIVAKIFDENWEGGDEFSLI